MSQTKVKSGLLNFPDQTDFVKLPSGTTAQRPSSPEKGYSRYNTTDNKLEYWNGTEWQQLPGITPPIITSISYPGDDLAADPDGGQTITITGSDFTPSAAVSIGNTSASVVTFVSATEITFTAPPKTAGDYDVIVTNVDGGNATAVDAITYNGLPSWTTPAGNLGTFAAGSTIPTITLVATEPDSGVVSYSVTTGALPTGLALTGADIDGTVPSPAGQTTYNFSVTASDDENQESTERAFNIVVYLQVTNTFDDHDPFDGNGIALYQLNGDATDESGNYNGTASNVTYSTGVFGQAGVFNGSSSIINLPNNSFNFTTVSVSFWLKLNSITGEEYVLDVYDQASGSARGYAISTDASNKIKFRAWDNNNFAEVFSSSTLSLNTWYYIAMVATQTSASIYINGSLDNSGSLNGFSFQAQQSTSIGAIRLTAGGGSLAFLDGSLDQVRIFNTTLTPLEVESLYRERTVVCGGQADTLDILGDNSCIATYQLNGNANDLSGNYSGTPTDVSYGVGEFDLAGVFNGSSSYINLDSLTSFFGQKIVNTVSLWFKINSTGNYYTIITDYAQTSLNIGIDMETNGTISVYNRYSNATTVLTTTSSYDDGNWHNIIISNNLSTISGYIDGQLFDSDSVSQNSWNGSSSQRFTLGAVYLTQNSAYAQHFGGSIDQVRIFNKALNSTEVTTLYNETACDALACSGTTNTLDILSDGSCVAAYPLDGSPADLSGNYNGVQGGNVTYPIGEFDLAASFGGSGKGVDLPSNTPVSGQINCSVSLWFNVLSNSKKETLVRFANNDEVLLRINTNGTLDLIGVRQSNTTYISYTTVGSYNNGAWHHLVMTRESGSIKFYINNNLDNTLSWDNTFIADANETAIGYDGFASASVLSGQIDQVRIFNKALSTGEVTTLYNETACN